MTDQNQLLLRARVQDLMHLLSFAEIVTPTPGDKPEAEKAMADIRRLLAAPAQPQVAVSDVDTLECIRTAAARIGWRETMDLGGFVRGFLLSAPGQLDALRAALSEAISAQQQAAQAAPEVTDAQIKAAVYERTKLNPNQAADVDLLQQITLAFRDLIRASKGEQ
jgi:hypothetical protein